MGRSSGKLYNDQLILHCYQSLRNIINISLFFLATMQKTVEIVVVKTLDNSCRQCYKHYLPKDIIIGTNQYKLVDLKFKIKVPDNITSFIISNTLLKQQQLEINDKFLPTGSRYKDVII